MNRYLRREYERRLREIREEKKEIREARRFIRTGKKAQMYTESSRQLQRYQMNLTQLKQDWDDLVEEESEILSILDGRRGRTVRWIYDDEV